MYTVNIEGHYADEIMDATGLVAYQANGVTAIETKEDTKQKAGRKAIQIIESLGINSRVLYVFA